MTPWQIGWMNSKGFYPIAWAEEFGELIFIFKTREEALKAFKELDQTDIIKGWWWDQEGLEKMKNKVEVNWLS